MNFARSCSRLPVLLCLLVAVGCGGGPKGPPRKQTVRVLGKVSVDGETVKPPTQVAINALREGANGSDISDKGKCFANEDGTFELYTYEKGDGLAAGNYQLTFRVAAINLFNGQLGPDELGGKYMDPAESGFTVTVNGDETEPVDLGLIELKSDE